MKHLLLAFLLLGCSSSDYNPIDCRVNDAGLVPEWCVAACDIDDAGSQPITKMPEVR